MEVKIINKSNYPKPWYAHPNDAGMDLKANINYPTVIRPHERILIPTGIFIQMPNNLEAQIRPRSGLAINQGITVVNSPGTIDPGFIGEIKVGLINLTTVDYTISPGERIAQMVFNKFETVSWIDTENFEETTRQENGFGSSGKL